MESRIRYPITGGTRILPQTKSTGNGAFIEFCESVDVTQSMRKAENPYDNAPRERYFNFLIFLEIMLFCWKLM